MKEIFQTGHKVALSDIVITSYAYLDVYFISLLLSPLNATQYLVVRKLVKGTAGLVSHLPKVILRQSMLSNLRTKKMSTIFISIVFVFFILFNIFSDFVYGYIFKVEYLNLTNLSYLFSLLIIFGPIQNLYLQTYVLKNNFSSLYMQSYIGGLAFFLIAIITTHFFSVLTIYTFAFVRVFSDVIIMGYSFLAIKNIKNE